MNPGVSCDRKVTHIVLPPNMDTQEFARHHAFVKWKPKTDMAGTVLGKHNAV